MNNKGEDVLKEAEEVAELGERKIQVREVAEELNRIAPEGEGITEQQIRAVIKNVERVAEMVKSPSGKCKVIGIDKFDYSDWVKAECDTPEEAIGLAERLTTEAKRSAISEDRAKVYYAYDPAGNYIGGNTWRRGEKGGLALTDEEESLVEQLKKVSLLGLQCKPVANPLPGSRRDIPWFQHPTLPDVFLAIVDGTPWWYYKLNDGTLKALYVDCNTPKEEVKKFLRLKKP